MDELSTRRVAKKISKRERPSDSDILGFITVLKYLQGYSPDSNVSVALTTDELWLDIEQVNHPSEDEFEDEIITDIIDLHVSNRRLSLPFSWKGNDPFNYDPDRTIQDVVYDMNSILTILNRSVEQ